MRLAVVTLTRNDRPDWLAECMASVQDTLPAGAEHRVVPCMDRFQEVRWDTTVNSGAEYVAWVDDDDVVLPHALARCLAALEATGAGIAFTHEDEMDARGHRDSRVHRRLTTHDVAMSPRLLHHLAVVRVSAIDPEILAHARAIGIGIDWLMRAGPALQYGAVQVPMVGYLWRRHAHQASGMDSWESRYLAAMPLLREITLRWAGPVRSTIPQWGPTE